MTEKEKQGREHAAAWKSSGLTQREYCERNGVRRSTLAYWSSRIKAEREANGFVEIGKVAGVAGSGSGTIEVLVADRYRVRLSSGFSADALSRVLEVLEGR